MLSCTLVKHGLHLATWSQIKVESLSNLSHFLKDSYETGLEADILVVRLGLASLLKALLILAGSVIQQTIKKPGLTSLGNPLLILAGSVIQQTIKRPSLTSLGNALIILAGSVIKQTVNLTPLTVSL